ncbi:MAG: hypothetical protein V8S69_03415 [Dakarella massiliensis]
MRFSGAERSSQNAGISEEAIRHFAGKLPILGVCLGRQGMGKCSAERLCLPDR